MGFDIDVNDLLYHQISDELEKKYQERNLDEQKQYEGQQKKLQEQVASFTKEKDKFDEKVKESIQDGIKTGKKKLEKEIKKKLESESSEQFKALQEELNEKSNQLKEFNKAKSEIERLKREKDEIQGQVEAEAEKTLNKKLVIEREKMQKLAEQKSELKLIERDKLIDQLKTQLNEAQRKAEQGSMQAQGEAQELAIEDWLRTQFPLDEIDEIKKGARGGDCTQLINTTNREGCGLIYYESKRTKAFQNDWIEKFKIDIREKNADIGVIVTEAMPSDMTRAGQKLGIWICTFEEFKILSSALRDSLIRLSTAVIVQENKGEKMTMIYDFLTSNEFRLQIEGIVEGFTQMQTDLESEKRAMTGNVEKERETNTEGVGEY